MAPRPRRSPDRAGFTAAIGVATLALLGAACGVDHGVSTLGAASSPAGADPVDQSVATAPDRPSTSDPATPGTAPPSTSTTPATTTTTLPPIVEPELRASLAIGDVIDIDGAKPARDHDEFVAVAFTDIERWWAEVYPGVYGGEFEPLAGGVYAGYPDRLTDLPGCGEPTTDYDDLSLYVAFYCQFNDFMVYDDGPDSLLTSLSDEFGSAVMGIVLAHEYGHVIQERTGVLDRRLATIVTEQQADCFAGAWTGQAYRDESPLLRLGDRDVRAGLVAMLSVRDPVGTNQFQSGGHGSAFDRVGAFQEGFQRGPARCAELIDNPLPLMPNEFQPMSLDFALGGNAPYDCEELRDLGASDEDIAACEPAWVFLADDLDEFWSLSVPGFPTLTPRPVDSLAGRDCAEPVAIDELALLCVDDGAVYFDEPAILDLYREFGDFTLGYVYGVAWAEAAQLTLDTDLTGEERALANDCLVGAWVDDITLGSERSAARESTVVSSPGDLDEAIRMAVLVGDEGEAVDVVGSPFEKIASFRAGVLGGFAACPVDLAP